MQSKSFVRFRVNSSQINEQLTHATKAHNIANKVYLRGLLFLPHVHTVKEIVSLRQSMDLAVYECRDIIPPTSNIYMKLNKNESCLSARALNK